MITAKELNAAGLWFDYNGGIYEVVGINPASVLIRAINGNYTKWIELNEFCNNAEVRA